MAQYSNYQYGSNWATALGSPTRMLQNGFRLMYVNDTEVGISLGNNIKVYFTGTGFTYATNTEGVEYLTGGKVTSLSQYNSGILVDSLTGILGTDGTGVSIQPGSRYEFVKIDAVNRISDFEVAVMSGNDTMNARTRYNNVVVDDKLNGWGGNDSIFGGSGGDNISGDSGNDRLFGDAGDDKLAGGTGSDALIGGAGHDLLAGGQGNDTLNGQAGWDTAFFLGKFAELTITKTTTGFTVTSLEGGTDTLVGIEKIATNDGVFQLNATTQQWVRTGGPDQSLMLTDTMAMEHGSALADRFASAGASTLQQPLDLIFGGDGNDSYVFAPYYAGSPRHDHGLIYAYGGAGDDTLSVSTPSSYLYSSATGVYRLFGEAGNDVLKGGLSGDELDGGIGNDSLNGGNGNDIMTGGAGADTFTFVNSFPPGTRDLIISAGNDVILDFVVGEDHLSFSPNTTFTLVDTTNGTLITATTATGPGITSTVLLDGVVRGTYTMEDFLV